MSLEEYKKKRDFSRTKEPEGKSGRSDAGHLYMIHKHAASRLHYDLRLELNGTLKSWAIPKGPSLDTSEKRLAVQVEDHPLSYGSFEGTIPKDQYGGGTVMIWDSGSWEPSGNPDEAFKKGSLKFRLRGRKLHGLWSLSKMGGKSGENGKNWLLIKKKDEEAVPSDEYNILEDKPLSAESGRSMDEIADAENGIQWQSSTPGKKDKKTGKVREHATDPSADPSGLLKARKAEQPENFHPQLATLGHDPPAGDKWIHEIKFDGYRILAFIKDNNIRLISRNGKDWTQKFLDIANALKKFPVNQAILDGEIVLLHKDGTSDFQALQNALKQNTNKRLDYFLFDLPHCEGYDLTNSPLEDRKNLLQILVSKTGGEDKVLRYSDHIRSSGDQVYRQSCSLALEGTISKDSGSPYVQKRSKTWMKTKCMKRQEFLVGGYSEPSGSRTGFGALLLGFYEDKVFMYAGKVGTGFTEKMLTHLRQRLKKLEQENPAFDSPPKGAEARDVHWIKPEIIVEVEFSQWTRRGHLRHPSFKGIRADKAPGEIVREFEFDDTVASDPKGPAMGKASFSIKRSDNVVIRGIKITSPDKILYPEQGATKRTLAEFYEKISEHILPFIVKRPLTLVRCPRGRANKCFYQKHINETMPDAVRGREIKEKNGTAEYIFIDDIKGLLSLTQMGALEIHPWGSSEPNLEKPDMLTFDLDPGPGIGWKDIIEGANILKDHLDALGLQSFVKTSGGKGIHIVIPIERRTGWDEAKTFTKRIAYDLAGKYPDRFVANMSKAKRKGKIFIDYLRNGRGATSVAVYSTRAREGAPVSVPIGWDELTAGIRPDSYNIENLPARLSSLKQDPWKDFFKVRQWITDTMKHSIEGGPR